MKNLLDIEAYTAQIQRILELPIDWGRLQGRTVLLSGASGMIGSFLTDVFMRLDGLNVIALSRDEKKAKERFEKYWNCGGFRFIRQNAADPIAVNEPVDYVLHAASNTHPRQYAGDPIGTIMTNIAGTKNMLDLAAKQKVCRFMFFSSVEVYGENRSDTSDFAENYCGYIDCNTLRAGYPESKRTGEALCQAYAASLGVDTVIPRLSRVYGPTMQKTDSKAAAQFIKESAGNRNITLKSAGGQLYSYTYAADAAAGLLYVLLYGLRGEAYNIAANGGHDITLKDLALLMAEKAGTNVVFEAPQEQEKQGYSTATRAVLNSGKLRKLGWKPAYSITEGLGTTVEILRALGWN